MQIHTPFLACYPRHIFKRLLVKRVMVNLDSDLQSISNVQRVLWMTYIETSSLNSENWKLS